VRRFVPEEVVPGKKVVPGKEELIFRKLLNRLIGEVGLTIPMAYLEGVAV
jgi:hypothetical protein